MTGAALFAAGWITRSAARLDAEVDRLTELDAARGDADHGVNMQRGFAAAAAAVGDLDTPGEVLRAASTALRRTVGGASGPLWSVALLRMGRIAGDAPEIDAALLADMLDAAVAGVAELGGAQVGEGTMLDALAPAAAALRSAASGSLDDAVPAAIAAAGRGAQDTATRAATKGRAAYLGDRSIGTPDPGAVSAAIVIAALADG